MHQQQTAFENIAEKEEIVRYEQFLLSPQCFLINQKIVSPFVNIFDTISLFAAELEEPKIGISGKGLNIAMDQSGCFCLVTLLSSQSFQYPTQFHVSFQRLRKLNRKGFIPLTPTILFRKFIRKQPMVWEDYR